jgi:hypothetical protein
LSKKLRLALPFRAYQNIGKGHNLFHGQNQIDDILSLARIFHESPAATTDMAVLPGVLGRRLLRRTVQVRLGFDLGFQISDFGFFTAIDDIELNSSDFAICSLVLKSFSVNFKSAFRNRRPGGPPASPERAGSRWRAGPPIFVVSRQRFMKYTG